MTSVRDSISDHRQGMLLHVSPLTSIDLIAVVAAKLIGIRVSSAHEASAAIKARILQQQAVVCGRRACVSMMLCRRAGTSAMLWLTSEQASIWFVVGHRVLEGADDDRRLAHWLSW